MEATFIKKPEENVATLNIIESRRFYGNTLGCEERRATPASVNLYWLGNQLTVHQLDSYNAKRMLRKLRVTRSRFHIFATSASVFP